MSVAALALTQLLASCAPSVGVRTMSSIVTVESGGNPLAIHDNSDGRSYLPSSREAAVALASGLIARGHSVDLGLAQINSANVAALGLTVQQVFDPCTNVRAGAQILAADYARASAAYGSGQLALRRAIGAYNTGQLTQGDGYISAVVGAARRLSDAPVVLAEAPTAVPSLAPKVAMVRRIRILPAAVKAKGNVQAPLKPADAPILVRLGPSSELGQGVAAIN
ncbi:MAG: lytic transglycosylase domain-containing protein [Vulcanimicrobiaceae bacterium]